MTAPRITTNKARELLAGATPGRWFQTIDGDLCAGELDDCEYVTDPEYGCIVAAADFHLFAAAPDLAADLIDARAQIAALIAERDEARQWAEEAAAAENANAADLRATRETFAAIHDALGNGADESAWLPGLTAAEAVARMRATLDAVAALVGGGDVVEAVETLVAKRDRKRKPALTVPHLYGADALLAWLDAEPGEASGAAYGAMDSRDWRWTSSMLRHYQSAEIAVAIRATLAASAGDAP